ncbi:hypothetical protein ACQEU5_02505 [Marinactinospora thermotolerans]|uniref:Uncharacterized protein n=1 Tax=Marinactinospora thermotolerans DSM 45154 TaxID=1122192 RepID=A0A1T4LT46_9ACTN|nr:hypothetical protein [Marinactinospora thermotolerans]SJZ57708.1 hypothetical protein SAMN02745673_00806 [Marinactinospora thermotolerans DSM 45154]
MDLLGALTSMEAAVISTALIVAGAVTRWRVSKAANEDAAAARADVQKAIETRIETAQKARELHEYEGRDPETGMSIRENELQQKRAELEKANRGLRTGIEEAVESRPHNLMKAETEIADIRRALAEARAATSTHENANVAMDDTLRLARIAGRLDEDDRVVDTTGLPDTYRGNVERGIAEWKDVQRNVGQPEHDLLREFADQTEQLARESARLKQGLTPQASTAASEGRRPGTAPDAPVSDVKTMIDSYLSRSRRERTAHRPDAPAPASTERPHGRGPTGPRG